MSYSVEVRSYAEDLVPVMSKSRSGKFEAKLSGLL
jgi:hypothetical protein